MLAGRALLLLGLAISLCLSALTATGEEVVRPALDFPLPAENYHDQQIPSILGKLAARIQREPLNLVATLIFLAAIIHTFLTARFRKIGNRYQRRYEAIEELPVTASYSPVSTKEYEKLIFRAQFFHFMGRSGR
jgi:hypothetical protein